MAMKSMKKISGFTLVELLVVISIIALLLSILMPSLQKARNAAARVVCLSNLNQIGLGTHVFANDHDGVIPTFAGSQSTQLDKNYHQLWYSWPGLLQPYITGKPLDPTKGYDTNIWWCPADKVSPKQSHYTGVVNRNVISYGINGALYTMCPGYPAADTNPNPHINDCKDGTKLYSLTLPSVRFYLSEHGKVWPMPAGEIPGTPVIIPGFNGRLLTFEDYAINLYAGAPGNYHGRFSNTLFADAHAKPVLFASLSMPKNPTGGMYYWGNWPLVLRIPGL